MEMEIHIFWRVFRTSVIVFDFRTNYGKSVLVGISAGTLGQGEAEEKEKNILQNIYVVWCINCSVA